MNTDEILKDIRANQARLDSCAGPHQFEVVPPETGRGVIVRYYVCRKCMGRKATTDVINYLKGLTHGSTHPELVEDAIRIKEESQSAYYSLHGIKR